MVGPNCLGVLNTDPDISLNATFAPVMPPQGPVGFISQSGAMGVSILEHACRLGIGISSFVSVGNRADVSGNDLLEVWRDDPGTRVILMYLESFGNPARFVEICRELTRTKPVCIVKSGRTGAGQRAAASHTGALAGTELATDALIAQAGALRVPTVAALFDVAQAFASQPLPRGNRVAIVTNAGGPGIIAADAAETYGLDVCELSAATQEKLRARLPDEASVRNPVDMIASADAASFEHALDRVLEDDGVDAAIAAFVPPLGIQVADVAAAIGRAHGRQVDKPVMAVLMSSDGDSATPVRAGSVPVYLFPESAARTLVAMWHQQRIAERPVGAELTLDYDHDAVEGLIEETLAAGRTMLTEYDAMRLLSHAGVPVVPWRYAFASGETPLPRAAAEAATTLGFPVAVKVVDPRVVHKSDVGGVALGLETAEAVERATTGILRGVIDNLGDDSDVEGVLVQRMAGKGTETIVGMTRVPRVGPLVMFGMGGIFVEVMKDVVLRLAPLRDTDAVEMVAGVKLHRLLEGVRGQPPRDLAALHDIILRVGQLAVRHPRLLEMDINPLLATPEGAVAVDARVMVARRRDQGL
jgi:acyl-CoA synthetase (NDP forming)